METSMNYFLLTWKPEFGSYTAEQFNELKIILRSDGSVKIPWSMRASDVNIDDGVILFRQGKVTGLYGFGKVTGSEEIITKDGSRKFEVTFYNLRDSIDQPFFSKKELIDGGIKAALLNSQASGHGALPQSQVDVLEEFLALRKKPGLLDLCGYYCSR
jgi:hypothetical protein